jgi:hypothetical protein
MGRKSQSRRSRLEQRKKPVPFIRRREVRYGLGIAAGFAVLTAILFLSNRSLWLAPERIVTIYRVHGCRCAFPWKRELERKGFSVVMNEVESLQFIRQRLRTPTEARGCHVGEYLGYFVEGHVHPTALHELSRRRPAALGLMTEVPARSEARHVDVATEASSRVLLVAPNSKSSVWFQAHATTEAGGTKEEEGT